MTTKQTILNKRILAKDISGRVKNLRVNHPTFVGRGRKAINICKDLSKNFNSNYAYILDETNNFGKELVLHGKINPSVVLLVNNKTTNIDLLNDFDLITCAGAKKIYIERLID